MSRKKLSISEINEKLKERGIEIVGEYFTNKIKTQFKGLCGHTWFATPNSIITGGNGCPSCAGLAPLSKEIINERLTFSKREILLFGEYSNNKTKTEFGCLHGHRWLSRPDAILNGNGCPECSRIKSSWSKEEFLQSISGRGIELIGEFINYTTKTTFRCVCGNIWDTRPKNIADGCGCRGCSSSGFNVTKPAWIYILKFANFIKYGISNNLPRRLKAHRKNGKYEIILSRLYNSGNIPFKWEENIKQIFGGRYVTKEQCPDGWTETLSIDKLQSILETIPSHEQQN